VQEKACQLFTEVKIQGVELEQVVSATEQRLEGPVSDALIQELTKKEAVALQQVEESRAKLGAFEEEFLRPE
jgi:hypothetical protein